MPREEADRPRPGPRNSQTRGLPRLVPMSRDGQSGAARNARPRSSLMRWNACIIACMVALQIREVPEELRDRLSELARQRGQSLQAYLFDVLSDEARRQDNLAVLDRFSKGSYGTRLSPADILGALDAGRAERDTEPGALETER